MWSWETSVAEGRASWARSCNPTVLFCSSVTEHLQDDDATNKITAWSQVCNFSDVETTVIFNMNIIKASNDLPQKLLFDSLYFQWFLFIIQSTASIFYQPKIYDVQNCVDRHMTHGFTKYVGWAGLGLAHPWLSKLRTGCDSLKGFSHHGRPEGEMKVQLLSVQNTQSH